jgi:DNA (cytosine-5)-methyltransferase 1
MVREFSSLIADRRPRAFVFENVEGFLTAAGGERVFDLLEPLIDAGYRIHLRKINAAAYGVPQHRKRVIAIGGLGWAPTFPAPTHNAFGAPGAHRYGNPSLPRAVTLGEALAGLPAVNPTAETWPTDHTAKPLSAEDLARARALEPGMTMRDLPRDLWHPSYERRANRRVSDGTPTERRGGAPAGLRRLRFDEPSKAITSGARSEFLHPLEDRALSLRECARIQTFDDSYVFVGTASEKATLIGNAVPPALAEIIGDVLVAGLQANEPVAHPTGGLMSFVPTASDGMSPALLSVSARILARYRVEDVGQLALAGL